MYEPLPVSCPDCTAPPLLLGDQDNNLTNVALVAHDDSCPSGRVIIGDAEAVTVTTDGGTILHTFGLPS